MCEHLSPLEQYLASLQIRETFRGQAWSDNCKEWIYYDCILSTGALKEKFNLPSFIIKHENTDLRSGTELGLVCTQCNDAIIGLHPEFSSDAKTIIVK